MTDAGRDAERKEPPFLEAQPPHWAARGLAYVLILLVFVFGIAAPIVKLPETVSAPFVLHPVTGSDPVQASAAGIVVQVHARDGQPVRSGEPLFIVSSPSISARSAELRTLELAQRSTEETLRLAESEHRQQEERADEARANLQERLAYLSRILGLQRQEAALADSQAGRVEELYQRDLVSWMDYTDQRLQSSRAALALDRLEVERVEAEAAMQSLLHEAELRRARYQDRRQHLQAELEQAAVRMNALRSELFQAQGNQLQVTAPCDGVVLGLGVRSTGAVVSAGDVLARMACDGERLQAEIAAPQHGLGRIRPEQRVSLFYDAFPYQRYGAQYATIRWISPSGITTADTTTFRIVADLDHQGITGQNPAQPVRAGMTGRAKVLVGRRSLLDFAFEPVRELRENVATPPARVNVPPQERLP